MVKRSCPVNPRVSESSPDLKHRGMIPIPTRCDMKPKGILKTKLDSAQVPEAQPIDDTVEDYVERIIYTLSSAIEEQIGNVQWTIVAKPQQG
ncbi:hypothetical protein M5K25_017529 [Dendrobium thyrsiflorum]|uniref:Uncharacterized protein n=1 Tax=Dendrobium thyrsiflorum TaxID=117978 RepID=A0ABD0UU91_DENTH